MTDGTNATEFKVNWAYQIGDMGFHGQMTIKCNTKVLDRVRQGNRCTTYSYKVWGKKERDLDFRPEDTIIASVLSSFSLSLFHVIQNLMSSIHFCIERKRSGIWWGGADLWTTRVMEPVHILQPLNTGTCFNRLWRWAGRPTSLRAPSREYALVTPNAEKKKSFGINEVE